MRYTREQLMSVPMNILKGIDIQSREEEILIQEIINVRLRDLPIGSPLQFPASVTDSIKSPEDEARLQKKIDEHNARQKAKLIVGGMDESTPPQEPKPEPIVNRAPVKFCDFCDSPGIYHKTTCTRPRVETVN